MLTELRIQNFAIIDELQLRFDDGLVIFTGETGAAELLGIKPTTLASRMKKMGIERPV